MKKILITGGAGFIGSNIAVSLRENTDNAEIKALDNLYRRGSELNIPRLEAKGVEFIKGDVRNPRDIAKAGKADFLIECSAEPSVLAGHKGDTDTLIETNLRGAINCAEYCRKNRAGIIFISTSRIYPIKPLLESNIVENEKRFDFAPEQNIPGVSEAGISEDFPLTGHRSLYGATKYAAEVMLDEYRESFGIPVIINRCGVTAGPWQFGKSDQGITAFWTAAHMRKKALKYIGFGGSGKQVRDILHIDDLVRLIITQLRNPEKFSKAGPFNIGGGKSGSVSLRELSGICSAVTGNTTKITPEPEARYADIPIYISDTGKIKSVCGWQPQKTVEETVSDIKSWLNDTPDAGQFF